MRVTRFPKKLIVGESPNVKSAAISDDQPLGPYFFQGLVDYVVHVQFQRAIFSEGPVNVLTLAAVSSPGVCRSQDGFIADGHKIRGFSLDHIRTKLLPVNFAKLFRFSFHKEHLDRNWILAALIDPMLVLVNLVA